MDYELIYGYLITGTVWGVTNAFMERGSKVTDDKKTTKVTEEDKKKQSAIVEVINGFLMMVNPAFLIPFLLN